MVLEHTGRILIFLGIFIILLGAVFMLAGKVPWLGRLPGDILIQREKFTFYFPLTTMILLSIILTIILNLIWRR